MHDMTFKGYDAWKLSAPDDYEDEIGTECGDTCGRYIEPDEDAPRGYKPRPCQGTMDDNEGEIVCDTCGEAADRAPRYMTPLRGWIKPPSQETDQ